MIATARSLLLLLLLSGVVHAQEKSPDAAQPADPQAEAEAAILAAIKSYATAFNQQDAAALAGHWTAEGEFAPPSGKVLKGREALQADFAAYFSAHPQAKLELLETQVSLLSPRVATEVGVAVVLIPDQEPSQTAYEAVHVKTAEGWKIDRISEQQVASPPPSHYEHLAGLEWMVGDWIDADGAASIVTNVQWTKNRNFLMRTFKVHLQDRIDFEGTQIIGWDPYLQVIRSWTFDSDGGFGSGRWTNNGNRWSVAAIHVLPDGRRGSSTNIYETVDANTIQFQSIGRQVDGELMPGIQGVTIVRAPAE
ncbi:MAG: YybH family protein [Blastopirellula sp. JB062]